eukprot:symbB.v1.2.005917.t3/scaffold347.1/size224350/12
MVELMAREWGYRFVGSQLYNSQEWLSFDFPKHPAKLYISKLQLDWFQKQYAKLRLVDTGGIDYWQGGVHYWHSKVRELHLDFLRIVLGLTRFEQVLFLDVAETAVEVNFSSCGHSKRGEGEVFDYSQVEIKAAKQLHEENGGDESWYSFQHTSSLASVISYWDIVNAVATVAWEYPYFTWDEAGTFDRYGQGADIKECHCRIFADRLLRALLTEEELSKIPGDMDRDARLPNVLRRQGQAFQAQSGTEGCNGREKRLEEELRQSELRHRQAQEEREEADAREGEKAAKAREEVTALLRAHELQKAEEEVEEQRFLQQELECHEAAAAERAKTISGLVASASQAAAKADRLHRQLQSATKRKQTELQAAQAKAALENRRAAQEQQLKRTQLQVLRAEVAEMERLDEEHRAAAAREAREVQLRREAAARRRRLAAQREVRPEQKRNTSFGSCDSESRSLGTLQLLRQQLADDKQRGEAAKAELLQKFQDLRSEKHQRTEEFETMQCEMDALRQLTDATMAEVEALRTADAALRAELEVATAQEVQLQEVELVSWAAQHRAGITQREAAAAQEAEALAARHQEQQRLLGVQQQLSEQRMEVQQLQEAMTKGKLSLATEEEMQEAREEHRRKAEATEEQRQAMLFAQSERQQRASRRLEQLRVAVRSLHEAEDPIDLGAIDLTEPSADADIKNTEAEGMPGPPPVAGGPDPWPSLHLCGNEDVEQVALEFLRRAAEEEWRRGRGGVGAGQMPPVDCGDSQAMPLEAAESSVRPPPVLEANGAENAELDFATLRQWSSPATPRPLPGSPTHTRPTRKPKRDEPRSGPIPAWVYESPSPEASNPDVTRPHAVTAASPGSPGNCGGAYVAGGVRSGGCGGAISGMGDTMPRSPPRTDTSAGLNYVQDFLIPSQYVAGAAAATAGAATGAAIPAAGDATAAAGAAAASTSAGATAARATERDAQLGGVDTKGNCVKTGCAVPSSRAAAAGSASAAGIRTCKTWRRLVLVKLDLLGHILLLHQSAQLQLQVQTEQGSSVLAGREPESFAASGRSASNKDMSPKQPHHADHADSVSYEDIEDLPEEEEEPEANHSISETSDLWHGRWRQHQERPWSLVGLGVVSCEVHHDD